MRLPLYLLLILLSNLINTATAQLLGDGAPFTRADTLRGSLTPLRTCYDVKYYHLDVKVDPSLKTVEGSNTIFFTVVQPFNRFQIDLFENLSIHKILFRGQELKFSRDFSAVFVEFPNTLAAYSQEEIQVFYGGKPKEALNAPWDGGFVWKKDNEGNDWIGVACQGMGASAWWPNKDHLSDEPDSMTISVTVPDGLSNVSNGRLKSKTSLDKNWTRFDWFVSYPINNYNVSVNIARYAHWSDLYINKDTLTLDYYVLPYNMDKAKKQFQEVKPMLRCYEKYLGKYPFYRDGYKLVETPYLGMEHQSAIAYGNKYLPGYLGKDYSRIGLHFDYIIIHETGHEWWGNNVGCSDLADMWIHESFCSYSEALYVECLYGYEKGINYVNARKPAIQNKAPIKGTFGLNNEGSKDMYDKGILFLNTLRSLIDNDPLWFDILKGIQKEFSLKTILEEDIINYINNKTGKDFTYFFDQYVKQSAIPTLEIKFEKVGKGISLSYRWTDVIESFKMPVKVTLGKKKRKSKAVPHADFDFITPTTKWQTQEINVNQIDFKVATDLFYINVKPVQ